MKRITLIVFISLLAVKGFADHRTFFGFYGGAGIATSYNYDAALSGGLDFMKGVNNRLSLGAQLFYQSYGIQYDNEAFGAKRGKGEAGAIVLNKTSYIFIAPKFDYGIRRLENVHFHVTIGAGFKMGGTEKMRKWDYTYGATQGNYDSTIDTSPNINSMLLRVGAGLTEYLYTGRHWRFTFTEELGFVSKSLSTTSDYTNGSRTQYTPRSLNPVIFSIQIGLTHYGFKEAR